MRNSNFLYFTALNLQINFFFLIGTTLLSLVVFLYSTIYSKKNSHQVQQVSLLSSQILGGGLLILSLSFMFNFFCFLRDLLVLRDLVITDIRFLYKSTITFNFSFFNFSLTLYGYIIIMLALFVGFFALLVSENKIKTLNLNFIFYFHYFLLVVYLFVSINDFLGLFLCYELLLLPSFFFVYFVSYTKKALQACLYFIIWTQTGSLLVLIACVYMFNLIGDSSFEAVRAFPFEAHEAWIIYLLLFFGFGIKFPLWPFHYWLTKTHVEASSGFSIYLSGFLVKSALFGFFTLTNLMRVELETVFVSVIAFLGACDASLKMWGQSDLKKLVAYCTVQEMNLIALVFLVGDARCVLSGILFSAAHAFLSTLMFYLVDCIYRRTHSRSIYQVQGLLHRAPNLSIAIFIMCVLYAGLPGTIKFSCEFLIFSSLAETSFFSMTVLLFIMNVLGLIGFSKPWFNVLFGLPSKNQKSPLVDLARREIYIILFPISFFFFFTYLALPIL